LLQAALTYASRKWHVFPLAPREKTPLGKLAPHGFKDATTNTALIRKWWQAYPDANIGIALGPSGLLAIDVDPRNGGAETFEGLVMVYGAAPPTATQASGRGDGGTHLVYRAPQKVQKAATKLGAGVDVKGAGGYIVAAPSIHPDSGQPYRGLEDQARDLTGPWLDLIYPEYPAAGGEAPKYDLDEGQLADVLAALEHIREPDRDTWLRIGAALHAAGCAQALWDDWASSNGAPYHQEVQDATWRGFKADRAGGASYRSILKIAQDAGWRNPSAGQPDMAFTAWVEDAEASRSGLPVQNMPTSTLPEQAPEANAGSDHGLPAADKPTRATSQEGAEAQTARRPTKLTPATDLQVRTSRPYTIKGVMPRRGIGVMVGRPGCGKTFAALDMAVAVTTGGGWHGHRTLGEPAAVIAAENPASIQDRLALLKAAGHVPAASKLYLLAPDTSPIDLRNPQVLQDMMAQLHEAGVRFTVIDTLARATPGMDENTAQDMGQVVAAAEHIERATRGFVLLIHHTGKDETKGARGSSALLGAVDVELTVRRNPGSPQLSIEATKARDGAAMERTWFQLETWTHGNDDEGDPIEAARLVKAPPPQPGDSGNSGTNSRQDHQSEAQNPKTWQPGYKPKGTTQQTIARVLEQTEAAVYDDPALPAGSRVADYEGLVSRVAGSLDHIGARGRNSADASRRQDTQSAILKMVNAGLLFRQGPWVGKSGQALQLEGNE
jgi:Bifunctional DNA primase/polymerase, N-terminal/AAA domain/Primase C terminal 2 (PriCT-2)